MAQQNNTVKMNTNTENRFRKIQVSKQVTITKVAEMDYDDFIGLECVKDLPADERDFVWQELLEDTANTYGTHQLELDEETDGGEDDVDFDEMELDVEAKVEDMVEEMDLPSVREADERKEREEREKAEKEKEKAEKEKAEKIAKLRAELAELEKA